MQLPFFPLKDTSPHQLSFLEQIITPWLEQSVTIVHESLYMFDYWYSMMIQKT